MSPIESVRPVTQDEVDRAGFKLHRRWELLHEYDGEASKVVEILDKEPGAAVVFSGSWGTEIYAFKALVRKHGRQKGMEIQTQDVVASRKEGRHTVYFRRLP